MTYALQTWDDAQALLDVATAALDTLPTENPALAGAPLRRFLSDGQPSYDCPSQLSVHMQTIGEQPTGGGTGPTASLHRVGQNRINSVQYVLTCVRCRPQSMMRKEAPPIRDLNLAARQHMADAWVLWNGIWRAVVAEQLFRKCDGLEIEGAVADDPSGGASGWVFRVSPVTGGYDPLPEYMAKLPDEFTNL